MKEMIDQALKSPVDIDRRQDPGILPQGIAGNTLLGDLETPQERVSVLQLLDGQVEKEG